MFEVLHRADPAREAEDEPIHERVGRDQEHRAEDQADLAQIGLVPMRFGPRRQQVVGDEQFSPESEGGVAVAEKPRSIGSDLSLRF